MAKRVTLKDVEYVTLWPDEFLKEFADQVDWRSKEMGCYWILNFNLYTHGGKMLFDLSKFAKLCREKESDFAKIWKRIESKFTQKNGYVFQKRVLKELRVSRRRMQDASNAGLRGAEKRWGSHNDLNTNVNETKPNNNKKNNTNTKAKKLSKISPISLRFLEILERIIPPQKQSDRKAYYNLALYIQNKVLDLTVCHSTILDIARDSQQSGTKPIAKFFNTLKRDGIYDAKAKS